MLAKLPHGSRHPCPADASSDPPTREPGGITLTGETYALVKDHFDAVAFDPAHVKGIAREVQPFALQGVLNSDHAEKRVIRAASEVLRIFVDVTRLDAAGREQAAQQLDGIAARLRKGGLAARNLSALPASAEAPTVGHRTRPGQRGANLPMRCPVGLADRCSRARFRQPYLERRGPSGSIFQAHARCYNIPDEDLAHRWAASDTGRVPHERSECAPTPSDKHSGDTAACPPKSNELLPQRPTRTAAAMPKTARR